MARKADGFSGADLAALIREAGMEALKEAVTNYVSEPAICRRHIERAFEKVQPSVREKASIYIRFISNFTL